MVYSMEIEFDYLPSLIPGLPNDLALQCILRVPRMCYGFLKSVNSTWRSALGSSFFYQERSRLALTDESLFIVRGLHPSVETLPLVECVEFDMGSQTTSRVLASWSLDDATHFFLRGQACIQLLENVLFVGGFEFLSYPSSQVYKFCILTNKMVKSSNMLNPRADFAWGVIGGRLYVAGGKITADEWTERAETYDLHTDIWSPIASLPKPLQIHFFFSREKRLFVKGSVEGEERNDRLHSEKLFSYDPHFNKWREERDMLGCFTGHPHCIIVSTEAGNLVCATLERYIGFFSDESSGTALRITRQISKLKQQGKGRWETVKVFDKVCTMAAFSIHGSEDKAVIVVPYDLSSASSWDFMGYRREPYRKPSSRPVVEKKDAIVVYQEAEAAAKKGEDECAADVVEICVKCCYCYACCFTSALLNL